MSTDTPDGYFVPPYPPRTTLSEVLACCRSCRQVTLRLTHGEVLGRECRCNLARINCLMKETREVKR